MGWLWRSQCTVPCCLPARLARFSRVCGAVGRGRRREGKKAKQEVFLLFFIFLLVVILSLSYLSGVTHLDTNSYGKFSISVQIVTATDQVISLPWLWCRYPSLPSLSSVSIYHSSAFIGLHIRLPQTFVSPRPVCSCKTLKYHFLAEPC